MKFFGSVVLRKVVRCKGSLKFGFKDGVFGDVFGDNVGEGAVEGFGADVPRNRGVVTEKGDVVFGGVIVNFRFDSG